MQAQSLSKIPQTPFDRVVGQGSNENTVTMREVCC